MNNQAEITKPSAVLNDAGNAQTTNQSDLEKQVKPDTPATVKLELSEEEADMIQALLSNYVRAYRSDRSVDYKPELVPREKVGQYPWVATPPAPEIVNPTYDWVNKKWYSKNGSNSLPEIAQAVKALQSDQQAGTTQNLALTKAVKELSEGQANQNKLLASMQNLMLTIAGSQKTAKPTAPTQATTATATDKQ